MAFSPPVVGFVWLKKASKRGSHGHTMTLLAMPMDDMSSLKRHVLSFALFVPKCFAKSKIKMFPLDILNNQEIHLPCKSTH